MTTPFHHFKNPYRSIGVGKPDGCRFGEFYGWLGSGIKDKNRVEIYEGDIVKGGGSSFKIFFKSGAFFGEDETPLFVMDTADLEVVGHAAAE